MALIVQKYGGNLLSTPEKIKTIALKIKKHYDQGDQVIAVVSAMGKTTDELISLAHQISPHPIRRELDMLLSAGERISMSLLSMAMNDLHIPAKSFTGSQSGILTERDHTQARIIDVKPTRIQKELAQKNMIIIAGFQGVSQEEKEITTLGRGGTDTTAVAMTYALKADRCEIMKEVGGIYSADPKIVFKAKKYAILDYETILEATYWGAQILHYRAVELAKKLKIPLEICNIENQEVKTLITGEAPMLETQKVLTVSSLQNILTCEFTSDLAKTLSAIDDILKKNSLPWPQILATETETNLSRLFISTSEESLGIFATIIQTCPGFQSANSSNCTVTATCFNNTSSDMSLQILRKLLQNKIPVQKVFYAPQSISVLVSKKDREKSVQALHELV